MGCDVCGLSENVAVWEMDSGCSYACGNLRMLKEKKCKSCVQDVS